MSDWWIRFVNGALVGVVIGLAVYLFGYGAGRRSAR